MADDKSEQEPAPAKAGVPKVVLILLVLNLAGVGAVAFKVFTAHPPTVVAAAEAEHRGGHGHAAKPGPIHTMEPFIVNLNEPQGGRFLRTTLDIELDDDKALAVLVENQRAVRDVILRTLSNLKVADTMGEENRIKIQKTIAEKIKDKLADKDAVKNIYFADFVVQ